jgi:ppGpp synthetase/RelA/SpoT-type nucleotidyltranferase
MAKLTKAEKSRIAKLVEHYKANRYVFEQLIETLRIHITGHPDLSKLVHSIKFRLKDSDHLRKKLIRKTIEAKKKGKSLAITEKNLFFKINDLGGFRILHLHTSQMREINAALMNLFAEQRYIVREAATAKTWDDESRAFFRTLGIKTEKSASQYTSVHYVVQPNREGKYTCEIQVRTLAEELWGEVNHKINYPVECPYLDCREQIAVLARVTSSCTRLVDSIFRSYADAESKAQKKKKKTNG